MKIMKIPVPGITWVIFLGMLLMSGQAAAAARILSATPGAIQMQTGKPAVLSIKGTGLNTLRSGALYRDRAGKRKAGRLDVRYSGSPGRGRLTLTLADKVKPGTYYVRLADSRGATTALPARVTITSVRPSKTGSQGARTTRRDTKAARPPARSPVPPVNKAPTVTSIVVPRTIQRGSTFVATVKATDDHGVASLEIRLGDRKQTLKARPPLRKSTTFRVKLTAPAQGPAVIHATASDASRRRSQEKTLSLTLSGSAAARTRAPSVPRNVRRSASTAATGTGAAGENSAATGNPGSLPDLIVDTCSVAPPHPTAADDISITLRLKNQGGATAQFPDGRPPVANLVNIAPLPVGTGYATLYTSSPRTIAAGASATATLAFPKPRSPSGSSLPLHAPGQYRVSVVVDKNNRVAESNNDNNSFQCPPFTISEPPPPPPSDADLVIESAVLVPSNASMEDNWHVRVVIRNTGSAAADFSPYDDNPHGTKKQVRVVAPHNNGLAANIPNLVLAPGQSRAYEFYPGPYGAGEVPGAHEWDFRVDPDNLIAERKETNNDFSFNFTLRPHQLPPDQLPDLQVTDCLFNVSDPANPNTLLVQARVRNSGLSPTGQASNIVFRRAGTTFATATVPATLAPGAEISVPTQPAHLALQGLPAGTYVVQVNADNGNTVNESNEANNGRQCSFVVDPARSLRVRSIYTSPARMYDGHAVELVATVTNTGAGQVSWSGIPFAGFNGQSPLFDPNQGGTHTLAAGQTKTLRIPVDASRIVAGEHDWSFQVLPEHVQSGMRVSIEPATFHAVILPYEAVLQVTGLRLEPEQPVAGVAVEIVATVTNTGVAPANWTGAPFYTARTAVGSSWPALPLYNPNTDGSRHQLAAGQSMTLRVTIPAENVLPGNQDWHIGPVSWDFPHPIDMQPSVYTLQIPE